MKRLSKVLLVAVLALSFCSIGFAEGEKATTDEIYQLVLNAHDVLSELGEEGLSAFMDPKGEFVYKDTVVIVMQCPEYVVAHPIPAIFERIKGKDLREMLPFHNKTCEAAKNPNGTWMEYSVKKPGDTQIRRNVAFVLNVEGTPYQVSASSVNETASIEELNKKIK